MQAACVGHLAAAQAALQRCGDPATWPVEPPYAQLALASGWTAMCRACPSLVGPSFLAPVEAVLAAVPQVGCRSWLSRGQLVQKRRPEWRARACAIGSHTHRMFHPLALPPCPQGTAHLHVRILLLKILLWAAYQEPRTAACVSAGSASILNVIADTAACMALERDWAPLVSTLASFFGLSWLGRAP